MTYITNARKMRPVMELAVQSLADDIALTATALYPQWAENVDYPAEFKVQSKGCLYRCIQEHSALNGWEPENAPSLWEQINETHAGTQDDPIPYSGNMSLTAGLYYIQDGVVYLCTRDTVNPVFAQLQDLSGIYVEAVE